LVTDVYGSIDVLISFQDEKVKGEGHSHSRPVEFYLVCFNFISLLVTLIFSFWCRAD